MNSNTVMSFDEFTEDIQEDHVKIRGEKIPISSIVGKHCIFGPFKISKSRFGGEVLQMQVEYDYQTRCVFTGANGLLKLIKSSMEKNGIDNSDVYDVRFEGSVQEEKLSNGTRAYIFSK